MKNMLFAAAVLATTVLATPSVADPIPRRFVPTGADRAAIQTLLDTYTKAVSQKDQALFESILLGTDIPFSDIESATKPGGKSAGTRNYAAFVEGVFHGPPFTQRFLNVRIEQDGALAQVSLVFVNTSPKGSSWGFKTLQLLKVAGRWKIVSEFYSGHPSHGRRPAPQRSSSYPRSKRFK